MTPNKNKRGSVTVFTVLSLGALLGLAALATETGRAWQVKNELQATSDAASLAGVGNLLTNNFTVVDEAGARTAAINMGAQHKTLGAPITISAADVEVGAWDVTTEVFTAMNGATDPNLVRAVRTVTRRENGVNGEMPTIFGSALGINSISVNSESIAYWGFAGGAGPGVVDLPIAIDCCAISGNTPGAACTQDYCQTIQTTPPNPCLLSDGVTTTSCLEFHSTPEQNSCWTEFDENHPSINTPGLTDIVNNGNSTTISGNPIYVDNGTKTPVIQDISDRFHGNGQHSGSPAGTDTDNDGTVDSWVVVLPVVECQNPGDNCGGGNPADVTGFVCFDLHEVDVTPAKIIKGDFICPTDPRCSNAGLIPGGTISGISAQYPVLVR